MYFYMVTVIFLVRLCIFSAVDQEYNQRRTQNSSSGDLGAQLRKNFGSPPPNYCECGETQFLKQFVNVFEKIPRIIFQEGEDPDPLPSIPPLGTPLYTIPLLWNLDDLLICRAKENGSAKEPRNVSSPLLSHRTITCVQQFQTAGWLAELMIVRSLSSELFPHVNITTSHYILW